jgi:hypothetical protein
MYLILLESVIMKFVMNHHAHAISWNFNFSIISVSGLCACIFSTEILFTLMKLHETRPKIVTNVVS